MLLIALFDPLRLLPIARERTLNAEKPRGISSTTATGLTITLLNAQQLVESAPMHSLVHLWEAEVPTSPA